MYPNQSGGAIMPQFCKALTSATAELEPGDVTDWRYNMDIASRASGILAPFRDCLSNLAEGEQISTETQNLLINLLRSAMGRSPDINTQLLQGADQLLAQK